MVSVSSLWQDGKLKHTHKSCSRRGCSRYEDFRNVRQATIDYHVSRVRVSYNAPKILVVHWTRPINRSVRKLRFIKSDRTLDITQFTFKRSIRTAYPGSIGLELPRERYSEAPEPIELSP